MPEHLPSFSKGSASNGVGRVLELLHHLRRAVGFSAWCPTPHRNPDLEPRGSDVSGWVPWRGASWKRPPEVRWLSPLRTSRRVCWRVPGINETFHTVWSLFRTPFRAPRRGCSCVSQHKSIHCPDVSFQIILEMVVWMV